MFSVLRLEFWMVMSQCGNQEFLFPTTNILKQAGILKI